MYDVNFSTTDPSTDVALHLHPKKIYNSEYDSRIMLAHFLEAFQNFSEKLGLESTGDTGFEFLERTIGFSDIKMLLLEYLEYPIDQDFYPIVEAATKLLAAISGLYNVKWINSLAKDIQVLKIIAINLNAIENAEVSDKEAFKRLNVWIVGNIISQADNLEHISCIIDHEFMINRILSFLSVPNNLMKQEVLYLLKIIV